MADTVQEKSAKIHWRHLHTHFRTSAGCVDGEGRHSPNDDEDDDDDKDGDGDGDDGNVADDDVIVERSFRLVF